MTSSRGSLKTGRGLLFLLLALPYHLHLHFNCHFSLVSLQLHVIFLLFRLQFEARNQKKEAKEMAVIEAMKRRDEQEQSEAAAQAAH